MEKYKENFGYHIFLFMAKALKVRIYGRAISRPVSCAASLLRSMVFDISRCCWFHRNGYYN